MYSNYLQAFKVSERIKVIENCDKAAVEVQRNFGIRSGCGPLLFCVPNGVEPLNSVAGIFCPFSGFLEQSVMQLQL